MLVPVVAFEVASERYGIEAVGVVEVVPSVPLRAVPGTVPGVAGLLRFRGGLVPVVDLGVLWAGRPSPTRMSSRIVVCELTGAGSPDGSGIDFKMHANGNEWRWTEQWIPHSAWFLQAVAAMSVTN